MSDLPVRVQINEEGPREGFQIEPGPIPTESKIALIDALSETGLNKIQVASFVNPKRVPGWADADEVVARFYRIGYRHYKKYIRCRENNITQKHTSLLLKYFCFRSFGFF